MAWGLIKSDQADQAVLRREAGARGRSDAQRGLPPSHAQGPGEAEAAYTDAAQAARSRLAARAHDLARALEARTPRPHDFAAPLGDAHVALAQIQARFAHELVRLEARAANAARDLGVFKETHCLARDARYPRSTLLQAGLLLLTCLFEAVFSAALFAGEDERGLLGGAVTAVGLSAANVTLGFLAGFLGLRYLQHRKNVQRVLGGFGFGLLALIGLALNVWAALWRENTAHPDALSYAVADGMLDRLMHLSEPQAIVLLMLGGGVWAFAALKGYSGFDDPYPEFGKIARAADEAEAELAEAREEMLEACNAITSEAHSRIVAMCAAQDQQYDQFKSACEDAEGAIAASKATQRAEEEACLNAITAYRRENRAARSSPAPAYFDEPITLAPLPDALADCKYTLERAGATIAAGRESAEQAKRALRAAITALTPAGAATTASDRA